MIFRAALGAEGFAERKTVVHHTARNRHFRVQATDATIERYYRLADERKVTLCVLREMAREALEIAARWNLVVCAGARKGIRVGHGA